MAGSKQAFGSYRWVWWKTFRLLYFKDGFKFEIQLFVLVENRQQFPGI
jgi:hypothetical protein